MSASPPRSRESLILVGIFVAALLTHGWVVTRNWTAGFMPGYEFRQVQTAIISYFIDQQNDFSLFYEAPILGKPWVGLLLEVPVYEWSVVLLSRATGLPHYMAARTVSVACFYLMLPALYLLLGRYQLARPKRLLVLALVLTCPVYIFYSRAFLMESMELMCCAWFLYGFVQMMDRRRWYWFGLAAVAGTGAALVKAPRSPSGCCRPRATGPGCWGGTCGPGPVGALRWRPCFGAWPAWWYRWGRSTCGST